MTRTLYHGLLKNRLDREAKIAFFGHLNYRFSFGVEYQSCSMINYISFVKIWLHFDEQCASYGFSCNKQRCCPYCYRAPSSSTFPRLPFGTLGKSYITILMREFSILDGGSDTWQPWGFRNANGSGSQQPPPPPPNFMEYLAAQTELLRQLVQGQQQQQQQRDDPMFINLKLLVTRNS